MCKMGHEYKILSEEILSACVCVFVCVRVCV